MLVLEFKILKSIKPKGIHLHGHLTSFTYEIQNYYKHVFWRKKTDFKSLRISFVPISKITYLNHQVKAI